MPVKFEGNRRWVEMDLVLDAKPEAVWQAMATGAGYAAWFAQAEIEEREGGTLTFDFGGGMRTSGEVTRWEPHQRFGFVESEWMKGAPPVYTDLTIQAHGEQSTVLMTHVVESESDQWDGYLESFKLGWDGPFEVLKIYLKHFAGKPGRGFQAMATTTDDPRTAWRKQCDGMGISQLDVGAACTLADALGGQSGVVEYIHRDSRLRVGVLRLTSPEPATLIFGNCEMHGSLLASAGIFSYADDPAASTARLQPIWSDWLTTLFPQEG